MISFSSWNRQCDPQYQPPGERSPLTLVELLRMRALEAGAGYEFIEGAGGDAGRLLLIYAELDRQARVIAAHLTARHRQGDRILLSYPPGLDFIAGFFGCLYAGMIAVPAYPPRRNQRALRLQAIIQDAQVQAILTHSHLLEQHTTALEPALPCYGTDLLTSAEISGVGLAEPNTPEPHSADPHIPAPQDIAFLQYTSGSTGKPKGVMVSHRSLLHNLAQIYQHFGHSPASRGLIWLPPYHDMGLIGGILQPLYGGFPVTLMAPTAMLQKPLDWLNQISGDRATTSGGPNFSYELCCQKITPEQIAQLAQPLDLSSWRVAFVGAEPIRRDTLERFAKQFEPYGFERSAFYPCYGLAEATLFVTGGHFVTGGDSGTGGVSCGQAGQTLEIVDPHTQKPCPEGVEGEIWIAGDSVASGYWQQPQATAETFGAVVAGAGAKAYLRSGDLGMIAQGELYVTGRLKDLIVIRGQNYHPQDLEQAVESSHPALAIHAGAALGVTIDGQEQLVILQEIQRVHLRSANFPAIEQAIRAVVSTQHQLQVADILLLKPGSIPKTSSGKIQRQLCKAAYQQGKFQRLNLLETNLLETNLLETNLLETNLLETSQSGLSKLKIARLEISQSGLSKLEDDRSGLSLDVEKLGSNRLEFNQLEPSKLGLNKLGPNKLEPNPIPPPLSADPAASSPVADRLIDWLRDYGQNHLNSRLIDERRSIPPYVVLDFGNQGLLGMQANPRYGGLGLDNRSFIRVLQQLGALDPTLALFVGLNNVLGIRPIERFAHPDWRDELLPLLASGRELAAFALTESGSGANPQAIRSQAVPHGSSSQNNRSQNNRYRINGHKVWSGSAAWSGVINVFVQQYDAAQQPLGISGYVLRRGTPGLRQGPEALTMGMRGMVQNAIHLDDVVVDQTQVLGELGAGMAIAQDAMMYGRVAIAAACIGGMKRCAQIMLRYSSQRSIATGSLIEHPITRDRLSQMTAMISTVEALVNAVAQQLDQGGAVPPEVYAACKITAPEYYWQSADWLVQSLGGRGYIEPNLAPQILRDARVLRIFEGPTETLCGYLGAIVLQQPQRVLAFMRLQLGATGVGDRLKQVLQEFQQRYQAQLRDPELRLWLVGQLGDLVAVSLVWAAAVGQSPQAGSLPTAQLWAQQQFERKSARLIQPLGPISSSADLQVQISDYQTAIGEIEQLLAGEDHGIDPALQPRPIYFAPSTPAPSTLAPPAPTGPAQTLERTPDPAPHPAPQTAPPGQQVQQWLTDWLSQRLKVAPASIDPNLAFADYGIDSVTAVELAQDLEEAFSLAAPLEVTIAWNFPTIRALAQHVTALAAPPRSPGAAPPQDPPADDFADKSELELTRLLAEEIAASQALGRTTR